MRFTPFLAIALVVVPQLAVAQMVAPRQMPGGQRPDVTRVQIQVTLALPGGGADAGLDEQRATQERLRLALYELANKECEILTKTFNRDCRLASLNVTGNRQIRAASENQTANGTASAIYELTPR